MSLPFGTRFLRNIQYPKIPSAHFAQVTSRARYPDESFIKPQALHVHHLLSINAPQRRQFQPSLFGGRRSEWLSLRFGVGGGGFRFVTGCREDAVVFVEVEVGFRLDLVGSKVGAEVE